MTHSYRAHYFHIIWSTKDRENWITPDIQPRLYSYICGILKNHNAKLIEIGGMADHVHLLIELNLPDKFSSIIRQVKSHSSSWMHDIYPHLKLFAWQDGYASFSISVSTLDKVRSYIQSQNIHHEKMTFEDEYKKFLSHHRIEYDERFVLG